MQAQRLLTMKNMSQIVLGVLVSGLAVSQLIPSSSSSEISSTVLNFPIRTVSANSEAPMTPLEACDLLQDLSQEALYENDEIPETTYELDKLKAQKLLYYAQGYLLAIFEKKIFNDPIVARDYGPAVRALHDHWKETKGSSLPQGIFKKARRSSQDITHAVQENTAFLRTVLIMFINYSGKDLIEKTHQEEPWIEAYGRFEQRQDLSSKSEEHISPDALIRFFRKPGPLFPFLSVYIRINSREPRKIQHIIDRLRFIISHSYYTTQDIDDLYRAFLNPENRTLIESIYASCRDNLAWENVDCLDCVLGYIFFPLQCEQLSQHFPVFLQFARIKRLLSLSARHGHPLAHAYLSRILDSYCVLDEHLDENDEPIAEHSHLNDAANQSLTKYLNDTLPSGALYPALYVGLLRLKFGRAAYCLELFEKGYSKDNAVCAYYYALRKRQAEIVADKNFTKLLNSYHEGLVPFLEAELATDQLTRFQKYFNAGEKGLPEGFFLAALIFPEIPPQANFPDKTDLYLMAGRKGFLAGYEKALEILLKLNKMQQAHEVCNELKGRGSTYGFALLGKALRGEEAKKAFQSASFIESYPAFRQFVANERDYENKYRNELNLEYNKIRIGGNYEQVSSDEL